MKETKSKIAAIITTVFVMMLLVLSGPVQAFLLGFTVDNTYVEQGQKVSILVNGQVEDNENVNIDKFLLDLSGPISISCLFLPNGTAVSSCTGITIERILNGNSTGIGYGYGYANFGPGNITFNITIDTTNDPLGAYDSRVIAFIDGRDVIQTGPEIVIHEKTPILESCSVRAKGGELSVNSQDFDAKGKLSFTIPKLKAVGGEGSFIAQVAGKRLSYTFNIKDILINTDKIAKIKISGEYRINIGNKTKEDAVITLDKINKKVSITGKTINAKNLDTTLIKGCKGTSN